MYRKEWGFFSLLLIICLCFFVFLAYEKEVPRVDNTKAIAKIQKDTKKDVSNIKQEIQKIEKFKRLKKASKDDLPQRFATSMIVGDSMVEAINDYQLLPRQNVLGIRGKRCDTIYPEIDQALSYYPDHLFICLGLNDISMYKKKVGLFIEEYQKLITYIKKRNQHVKIYIHSLIPVSKFVEEKRSEFKLVPKYNSELKKLCDKNKITFIDNTYLVNFSNKVYERDGIHPVYAYYPMWISNMLNIAGE